MKKQMTPQKAVKNQKVNNHNPIRTNRLLKPTKNQRLRIKTKKKIKPILKMKKNKTKVKIWFQLSQLKPP